MSETQRNIPAEAVTESRKEADRPLSGEELRAKALAITEGYSKRLDDLPNLRPSDRERLKGEFKVFVLDSATSVLSGPLSEYSAAVADTDGEPGLDAYEFAKYSKGLEEAFRLLIESGGMEKLRATLGKFESEAKESFSVKNFDLFSKHAPNSPDRPANFLTEKYLASVSNISPEETRRLLSAKLGEDPEGFKKGLKIAVGTKAPAEFFEIAGRFAYDAVKAIPQSVEYSALALRSSFADTPLAKKELSIKMRTILDDNSVVGLFVLGSDSLAAVTNSLFGTDAATDGHLNRARELLHRMGNPMTWTPEGSKDVLLALTPVVLKIRQMWNARKEAPVAPKAPKLPEEQSFAATPDLSKYDSPAKLSGLKERLGLPEAATAVEIGKAYAERFSKALEGYSELGKENLPRIGKEFVERLRAKGIPNPEKVVADEVRNVKEAYARGEIVVVHLHKEAAVSGIRKDGFLSPYQGSDTPFSGMPKYGQDRSATENRLGILGLDPKYVAVLAYKDELANMSKRYGVTAGTELPLESFKGAAGVTMYDSMLLAKTPDGPGPFMFSIEDALSVRALKNLGNRYDIGHKAALESEALAQPGVMKGMYRNVPDFVEIQVMGRVPYPEGKTSSVDELTNRLPNNPKPIK